MLLKRRSSLQAQARQNAEMLSSAQADPSGKGRAQTLASQQTSLESALHSVDLALAQLTPQAPFPGVFRLADVDLRAGQSLSKQDSLGFVVGDGPWLVQAYLDEDDARTLGSNATGRFVPNGLPDQFISVRLASLDSDATRSIDQPMLTTLYGGSIPARATENEIVPEGSVYRVVFETDPMKATTSQISRRGTLIVRTLDSPLLVRAFRKTVSVLWQEAGF